MIKSTKREWLVPAALITLSIIPILQGTVRLVGLAGGVEITAENARYFEAPLPAVLHIVGVSIYCVLGAFQFAPGFRYRKPGWHRAAGRLLIPCGLTAALSGLWLNQFYPPIEFDGPLIYGMRILVGTAWALFICLGFAAIRRRDFQKHSAWMIRGYALGLGGGTQVLTILPFIFLPISFGEFTKDIALGAGWAINFAVAEWIIRKEQPTSNLPFVKGRTSVTG
ncbi:MAG: DUF2306 domain-containing protein [Gammaproteobacteria bacterium]|nr:DUF2306 domain-containing protein [Gammaproteobacteria bacterium]